MVLQIPQRWKIGRKIDIFVLHLLTPGFFFHFSSLPASLKPPLTHTLTLTLFLNLSLSLPHTPSPSLTHPLLLPHPLSHPFVHTSFSPLFSVTVPDGKYPYVRTGCSVIRYLNRKLSALPS
ncbi:uncharacterized protein PV06_11088 [Exophiala oligosperma]|uniref:Uncharacterized protein n=1 Tax=Exophiala oligosperma TaxID=215243 RepID=A0A0D2D330_9EURO|nr:uncharacterized protein PV06_11088 [Exophiala oligosperma]KIW36670.1 hypothetical protein PV06_11088 [Exophiala oligosperma]